MYQQPLTPEQITLIRRNSKRKLIWGIVCLVGPTILFIASMIFYATVNLAYSIDTDSAVRSIINALLFLIAVIMVITWLPGIIVGIILLVTRDRTQ